MNTTTTIESAHALKAIAYLSICAILWGGVFHVIKVPLALAPPFVVLFTRFLLSAIVLFPFLYGQGAFAALWQKENRVPILLLSVVGIVFYNAFFTYGMLLTDPATGSLIIASNPVMTALLASSWEREKISKVRWVGIAAAFVGLGYIVMEGSLENLIHLRLSAGNLILLGAPFCWAIYSVRSRIILHRVPTGAFTAAVVTLSLPIQGTAAAFQLSDWLWATNGYFWLSIAYLGVFSTGVAYMFWNKGVELIGAARSSIFINLIPVTALLISVLLGQQLQPYQMIGGAVVIVGVFLGTRK